MIAVLITGGPAAGNAKNSYLKFDRRQSRLAQQYVARYMFRLTQIASIEIASARAERGATRGADQGAFNRELERVLNEPENRSIRAGSTKNQTEIEALLARMDTYIGRAAEPSRIRAYVHARVDELEEALRTSVPDKQFDRLESAVEDSLFPNEAALVALEREPIGQIIGRTDSVINRWFQDDALKAIEEALFESPFSAYWFYVQTGGLPRASRPYAESKLTLTAGVGFSLDRMKSEPVDTIVERLHRERIPESYIEQHDAIESELREVVLTRQEALKLVNDSKFSNESRKRLEAYLQDPNESDTVSSIDVYRGIGRRVASCAWRMAKPPSTI